MSQREILLSTYKTLEDEHYKLAEYLMDECGKLDEDPMFEPTHDCAVFEDADPEIDDFRYQIFQLAEELFELLKERYPDVPATANALSTSPTAFGSPEYDTDF